MFDRKTGRLLGYLGNITTEGIMIISEEPLEVDGEYKLRMDLPDDLYQKAVLNFDALSMWCQPDIDPNFYNTGFRLIGISEHEKEIVNQILGDYEIKS